MIFTLSLPGEKEFPNIHSNQKLLIDPGMAFGTGNHETTKLCLKYLIQNLQKALFGITY